MTVCYSFRNRSESATPQSHLNCIALCEFFIFFYFLFLVLCRSGFLPEVLEKESFFGLRLPPWAD